MTRKQPQPGSIPLGFFRFEEREAPTDWLGMLQGSTLGTSLFYANSAQLPFDSYDPRAVAVVDQSGKPLGSDWPDSGNTDYSVSNSVASIGNSAGSLGATMVMLPFTPGGQAANVNWLGSANPIADVASDLFGRSSPAPPVAAFRAAHARPLVT